MKKCFRCSAEYPDTQEKCLPCGVKLPKTSVPVPESPAGDVVADPAGVVEGDGDPFAYLKPAGLGLRTPSGDTLGPSLGESIPLGKHASSPIFLSCSEYISAHHAALRGTAAGLSITDLGSTNGTFVNEERLVKGQERLLKLADCVRFATVEPLTFTVVPVDTA